MRIEILFMSERYFVLLFKRSHVMHFVHLIPLIPSLNYWNADFRD